MTTFMRVVLGINIALVALIDLSGYIFHVGPTGPAGAAEPIVSRQYAAVALGYAVVLLFVVMRRFQREPIWLLVPAMFLIPLWVDALYELFAGTGQISDYLPPAIIRPLLVASYVAGYLTLRRTTRDEGLSANPGREPAGAAATR